MQLCARCGGGLENSSPRRDIPDLFNSDTEFAKVNVPFLCAPPTPGKSTSITILLLFPTPRFCGAILDFVFDESPSSSASAPSPADSSSDFRISPNVMIQTRVQRSALLCSAFGGWTLLEERTPGEK
jgi:hypothetical protein